MASFADGAVVDAKEIQGLNLQESFFEKLPIDKRYVKKGFQEFFPSKECSTNIPYSSYFYTSFTSFPGTALNGKTDIVIQLPILSHNNVYFLSHTFVMADVFLAQPSPNTDQPVPDLKYVGPINSPLSSMFEGVDLVLNGYKVNSNPGNFAYKSFMVDLMQYDDFMKSEYAI